MKISATEIPGVMVVETAPHADQRGSFVRFYCERELASVIGHRQIVQINHSLTHSVGAIRGMHYQNQPHSEMKLVRCLKGRIWDVAVDLRAGSPAFLCWHAEELSADNNRMLIIPEGCAHGYQVLKSNSELLYLHTAFYAPEAEGGVHHNDLRLEISWPLPVTDISKRDATYPPIGNDFHGLRI